MLRNRTIIEVEVKGREFRFECFSETPMEDVLLAIQSMHTIVSDMLKAAHPPQISEEKQEAA
jgi:hypothetical protein